jgi:hypothetical protein
MTYVCNVANEAANNATNEAERLDALIESLCNHANELQERGLAEEALNLQLHVNNLLRTRVANGNPEPPPANYAGASGVSTAQAATVVEGLPLPVYSFGDNAHAQRRAADEHLPLPAYNFGKPGVSTSDSRNSEHLALPRMTF